MARTKPGPAAKREPPIPRTLNSLNLSKDIVIFDGRSSAVAVNAGGSEGDANSQGRITRLNGTSRTPKQTRRRPEELAPRWGEIDPATEDSDEIVQLFNEWTLHLDGLGEGELRVVKKSRKRYPREYKLKALVLYRVGVVIKQRKKEIPNHSPDIPVRPEWERISQNHAATLLGIAPKQLREWEKAEDQILESVKGSRQVARTGQPKWPEMEAHLHLEFKEARKRGRAVNHNWFQRRGRRLFEELYPEQVGFDGNDKVVYDCLFSGSWFTGFKGRWHISWRCKTNTASKTPEDYRPKILMFWRFNRRNSQLRPGEAACDIGRYPLGNMFNMDQTPFPFEFLTGRTYEFKGNKTVWEKALRASWAKRQATLQLTICADGIQRCAPLLIFRGTGTTKALQRERAKYDPRVRCIFNAKGYSNQEVTLDWLVTDLIPSSAFPEKPRFIALDVFAGQKTAPVLNAFRNSHTVTSFIPEGCTGLVQPLDTAVNKTLKAKISELLDDELDRNPELWESGRFSVGDRRVLMTWIVGDAWDWLHREKSQLIINSFRHVGITLAIDGSEDTYIKVKGLENLEIGDWREGGLDCNLDKYGKTGMGELKWDSGLGHDLFDPVVAEEAQRQLADLDKENEEGEYVDLDDLS